MRKTRKETKAAISLKNEVIGIAVIALSLLVGLSIYITPSGQAGIIFRKVFTGLFGFGSYITPIIIFLIGVAFIVGKEKMRVRQRFIAICFFIFTLFLMAHVYISDIQNNIGFSDRITKAYEEGLHMVNGGVVSELISSPIVYIFGKNGTYVVLAGLLIIFLILSLEVSIKDLSVKVFSFIKASSDSSLSRREEKKKQLKKEEKENPQKQLELPVRSGVIEMPVIDEEKDEDTHEEKVVKLDDYMKNKQEKMPEVKANPIEIIEPIKPSPPSSKKEEKVTLEIPETGVQHGSEKVYNYPSIELLNINTSKQTSSDKKELLSNAKLLEDTLLSFGVEARVVQVSRGPSVTRYELQPSPGVKVSKIVHLADDIALNLAAPGVRIEAPVPGKAVVGIEVPNKETTMVLLREVIDSNDFMDFKSKLAFALGKDISGKCIVTDIAKMPHLLIAGATGSGKSVCINTLITSLIYKSNPDEVKMLMIDPKVVELSIYNGIPHLLIPVVTDPKKASSALYWAVNEMTQRYKQFADNNVRNVDSFNKLADTREDLARLPQIVIIIDELADLMMATPQDVEDAICRLAQMARAAGMHLVIATQRPSVDVITGVIKANIPSRISFAVSSGIDSRTILDMAGAEKLLGKGDMLFLPIGESKPLRIQGAFISEKEVENIVEFLKASAVVKYDEDIIEEIEKVQDKVAADNSEDVDELLPEAIRIAVDYGQVSASMLQRRLRVGFNRAARLIEEMELRGIVGGQEGSKPRQVLMSKEQYENELM